MLCERGQRLILSQQHKSHSKPHHTLPANFTCTAGAAQRAALGRDGPSVPPESRRQEKEKAKAAADYIPTPSPASSSPPSFPPSSSPSIDNDGLGSRLLHSGRPVRLLWPAVRDVLVRSFHPHLGPGEALPPSLPPSLPPPPIIKPATPPPTPPPPPPSLPPSLPPS